MEYSPFDLSPTINQVNLVEGSMIDLRRQLVCFALLIMCITDQGVSW